VRNQFARTLEDVGASDEKLVVLLGDISVFLLRGFQERFPERFYNLGICEQTIISMAAGLSAIGFYPVVHTITPFAVERCYEQIKIDLCYQKLGANIVSVGSAFDYAALGCSHHCYEDFALLRPLPDMQIILRILKPAR
jgi:transketolase